MNTKLYVGNLSFKASEDEIKSLFSEHGNVEDVFIVKDKYSGRSKGFAFVTLDTPENANKAAEALNGSDFLGRPLVVNDVGYHAFEHGDEFQKLLHSVLTET